MSGILYGINFQDFLIPGIGIIEKIIRPAVVYLALIIGLRLAGKRELAQLNTFDFVVLLSLSNTVQNAIIGNDNSVSGGLIGAATLLLINHFVIKLIYKHKKLQRLFEGEPDILISNGKIRKDKMQQELITPDELNEAAHKQGIDSLSEVKTAVLDPDGVISFTLTDPSPETIRHKELNGKLHQILKDLEAIKKEMNLA
ncbi:MAG TPA: YetF domain-containing protein [Spirochaetota bacterium]